MLNLKSMRNPDLYHGRMGKTYFEGWYFKLVDSSHQQVLDYSGGKGYIEKNWGSAFPFSWVWIQCNHFQKERASLSCSLAHIPFLFTSFRGFLIGFFVGENFYSFTTMNRSKVELIQKDQDVILNIQNLEHTLSLETWTEKEKFILLKGPRDGEMIPLVQENLQGIVKVELKENKGGKILFSDEGICAGIEYGGKQMMILDKA